MRRLHLKLYLAIVGTMVVFLIAGAVVWHHFAPPRMAMGGIESATQLAAAMLDEGDHDPAREREVVVALSQQLHADVALYDAQGSVTETFGWHAVELTREQLADPGWLISRIGPVLNQPLEDGRHLTVRSRQRYLLHGLHFGLLFISIAAMLALLTYPDHAWHHRATREIANRRAAIRRRQSLGARESGRSRRGRDAGEKLQ